MKFNIFDFERIMSEYAKTHGLSLNIEKDGIKDRIYVYLFDYSHGIDEKFNLFIGNRTAEDLANYIINVMTEKYFLIRDYYIKDCLISDNRNMRSVLSLLKHPKAVDMPAIEKVIFNEPATIVMWKDGTKTVVKCQDGDTYDPEKGLAMAISKRALGNQGNYCEVFKKWLPEEEKTASIEITLDGGVLKDVVKSLSDSVGELEMTFTGIKK